MSLAHAEPASTTPTRPGVGAILLAGGRASRMDGVAKPRLEVGGRSLLARAVDAVRALSARPITIAGPRDDALATAHPELRWVREDPPFTGPAAAIVASLRAADSAPEWTFVLACDLPLVGAAVRRLWNDILLLPSDTDGVCLADSSSRPQWLTGAYRTARLQAAADRLPDAGRNASVRALLGGLAIAVIAASADLTADVDTWEDLHEARRRAGNEGGRG